MPLLNGYSYKTLQANIAQLRRDGYPPAQASAIAFDHARKSFFKAHPQGALPVNLTPADGHRLNPKLRKKNPVPPQDGSLRLYAVAVYADKPDTRWGRGGDVKKQRWRPVDDMGRILKGSPVFDSPGQAMAWGQKNKTRYLKNPIGGLSVTQKIKKMGGIDLSFIRDISGESRTGKGRVGIPPGLFTRNGRGLDDLAISLHDAGYPVDVGDVDGGVSDLRDMVRNEIDGYEKYYPGDPSEVFEEQYGEYFGYSEPVPKPRRAAVKKKKIQRRASYDLADRPSQTTGRAPSRRLVARRMKNNQPGYFPNPVPASKRVQLRKSNPCVLCETDKVQLADQTIAQLHSMGKSPSPKIVKEYQKKYEHLQNPVPASKRVQLRNAKKLFSDFTGHRSEVIDTIDKPIYPDVAAVIGEVDGILYTTVRDGVVEKYIHKFKKKCRPTFAVSHDGKQLFMLGGSYDFTELGIVDKT